MEWRAYGGRPVSAIQATLGISSAWRSFLTYVFYWGNGTPDPWQGPRNGKLVVKPGRKAMGLRTVKIARLPNGH